MQITVTGKQIDVGDSLRSHIGEALAATVDKYFGKAIEATVVMSREGHLFRADVAIHVGRGILVRGHDAADDAYTAFGIAAAHLAKRLRRHKRRLRDHNARGGAVTTPAQQYVIAGPASEPVHATGAGAEGGDAPVVIAEQPLDIDTLSVSEAVMRLDLEDTPALMFRNAAKGTLNVVYWRPDGNVGWIDPSNG
ncbi:MAG: ribosome-associated translation inhibitor RaiA [Alphaproteobacteria bacterium]|nr:ribosome-associated translation inhibitor RaiA [Alphaproteobacteria bacterium]